MSTPVSLLNGSTTTLDWSIWICYINWMDCTAIIANGGVNNKGVTMLNGIFVS